MKEIEDIAEVIIDPELAQNHCVALPALAQAKGPLEVLTVALNLEEALATTICKGEIELEHFSVILTLVR